MSQLLAGSSDIMLFTAMIGYALALLAYAAAQVPGRRREHDQAVPARVLVPAAATPPPMPPPDTSSPRLASRCMLVAVLLHAAAMAVRGAATGTVPLGTMYEFVTASALAVSVSYLLLTRTRPEARALGLYVAGGVAAAPGSAVTGLYTEAGPLIPALRSGWLAIHVTAAVAASGAFTLGAITSVSFLYARRHGAETDPQPQVVMEA
ncbi:hypothetical protein [Nonomuraea diastatica]|uniref:C-type cytochrome biogenesis protein CcsB n=1 Tax=Nonomuraea diastatica TaxID=1848329 RepID=A0A4R4VNE4_9ACTN|nr:hypothetical protein [Nonomuraea diastatica]TDD03964.1 hypothetical protein E1294_50435 [Nonomuraea diastatica]